MIEQIEDHSEQPGRGLPYRTALDPRFAEGVRRFVWQPWMSGVARIGSLAAGPCPVCGHTMAVYRRKVRGDRIIVACNCQGEHSDRPDGVAQGCGQRTVMDLRSWDSDFGANH